MGRAVLLVGAVAIALGMAVATAPGTPAGTWPDVRGTWSGPARVSTGDGRSRVTDSVLVIVRQDADLLWATIDDGDPRSAVGRIVGSLTQEGRALVLSGTDGTWIGTFDRGRLRLDLVSPGGGTAPGPITATLTRR